MVPCKTTAYHKLTFVFLTLLLCFPGVMAATGELPSFLDTEPTVKIQYSGLTPIASALAAKASPATLLKTATVSAFSLEKYPLEISSSVTIDGFRCDAVKCGYWISATRDGKP